MKGHSANQKSGKCNDRTEIDTQGMTRPVDIGHHWATLDISGKNSSSTIQHAKNKKHHGTERY